MSEQPYNAQVDRSNNVVAIPVGEEKTIYNIERTNKYLQSYESFVTQILSNPENHFQGWGNPPTRQKSYSITSMKDPKFKRVIDYTTANFAGYLAQQKNNEEDICYYKISDLDRRLESVKSCEKIEDKKFLLYSGKIQQYLSNLKRKVIKTCNK